MFKPNTHLLVIDPQNDFCDIPESALPCALGVGYCPKPALPVAGADADMRRLARLVYAAAARNGIDRIHATLDSHSPVDIAHPSWWVSADGAPPGPYTRITAEDVAGGVWRARDPAVQDRTKAYVEKLGASMVWPEHCLVGSWGHNVHAGLMTALDGWSRHSQRPVNWVLKGLNPFTEHFSALKAEVPDPADPGTWLNEALVQALASADQILVAGEALSHCVAGTVRDLADVIGPEGTRKLVLLSDCSSPVRGFEPQAKGFVAEMRQRGMRVARSADFLV